MKITKRKDKKNPLLVTLSDGRKIIVGKQTKYSTKWLKKHGCPFVSQFEVYQWLGMGVADYYPHKLWKWAKKHIKKHIRATLTMQGLLLELKHYAKNKATIKYYAPDNINEEKITRFLEAGAMIIITKKKPIHYYTLIMDDGQIYSLRYKGCKVKEQSAKFVVSKRCKKKRYGGMIVITPKKKVKK